MNNYKLIFYFSDPISTGGDINAVEQALILFNHGFNVEFLLGSKAAKNNNLSNHAISNFPPQIPFTIQKEYDDFDLPDNVFLIAGEVHNQLFNLLKNVYHKQQQLIILNQSLYGIASYFTDANTFNNYALGGLINNYLPTKLYLVNKLGFDVDKLPNCIIPVNLNLTAYQQQVEEKLSRLTFGCFNQQRKLKVLINNNFRKREAISYMVSMLLNTLYPELKDKIEIINFSSLESTQVKKLMLQSDIFISHALSESYGMMTKEAMNLGCLVYGYRGIMDDNLNPSNGIWVDYPYEEVMFDIFDFTDQLAIVIDIMLKNPTFYLPMIKQAIATTNQDHYPDYQQMVADRYHSLITQILEN